MLPLLPLLLAYSRFGCPSPRSSSSSIPGAPCGLETNSFGGVVATVKPGPLTVRIEVSNNNMAPWRIALSGDGNDTQACTILDHIPGLPPCTGKGCAADEPRSEPTFGDESTYTQLLLTIDIPDVACERCSLHLANPIVDSISDADGAFLKGTDGKPQKVKTSRLGSPRGGGCTYPGGNRPCPVVHHSCTTPLKITGKVPRSQLRCPGGYLARGGPSDWPRAWKGDGGEEVSASTPGVYRREWGNWKVTAASANAWSGYRVNDPMRLRIPFVQKAAIVAARWRARDLISSPRVLMDAPVRYRTMTGPLCIESKSGVAFGEPELMVRSGDLPQVERLAPLVATSAGGVASAGGQMRAVESEADPGLTPELQQPQSSQMSPAVLTTALGGGIAALASAALVAGICRLRKSRIAVERSAQR